MTACLVQTQMSLTRYYWACGSGAKSTGLCERGSSREKGGASQ